ncbi:MAG: sporulation protein YunB [Bacillota bacterium]|nr:sporulation protein YunB [Bacillota bacterium]
MSLRGWWYRSLLYPRWRSRGRGSAGGRTRPRSSRRRRWTAAVASCLVILALVGWAGAGQVMASLWARAEGEAVLLTNQAVYRALDQVMAEYAGRDLIRVQPGDGGQVRYVQPDIATMQRMAAGVLAALQEEIRRQDHWLLYIPLGQLLGNGLWAGWGPRIPVRVSPVGTARIDFRDSFEGAGINQTRYALYLHVVLGVTVASPFWSRWVETTCSIPVAQTVIVGEVPPGMLYTPR